MNDERRFWGLFGRRARWGLTWKGRLVAGLLLLLLGYLGVKSVHPFLAVNDPRPGGVLVVEGWGADAMMRGVMDELGRHPYAMLCVTGGPLERGEPLAGYKTWAELGAATLARLGAATNQLFAVPAPAVRQDRTYASAVALRRWLQARGPMPASINLITDGPHARRSRLLFQRAFGDATPVGVVAFEDGDFEPDRWWTSSQGVRVVLSETIAYLYARCLFRAPEDP